MSFECGSWDVPLKTSFVTMWELMKPSCCPNPNAALIWDVTVDIVLELSDNGFLLDLEVIHHLLALKFLKRDERSPTEPSEKNSPSDWTEKRICLVSSCGTIGRVRGTGYCLNI